MPEHQTPGRAFGEFILNHRTAAGMTMREFADRIGVSAPYVSDIEKGRRDAPDAKLAIIANVFHLDSEGRAEMYELAASTRPGQVPVDLVEYIMGSAALRAAIRAARDAGSRSGSW